jgi:hypothetical protein
VGVIWNFHSFWQVGDIMGNVHGWPVMWHFQTFKMNNNKIKAKEGGEKWVGLY